MNRVWAEVKNEVSIAVIDQIMGQLGRCIDRQLSDRVRNQLFGMGFEMINSDSDVKSRIEIEVRKMVDE